MSFVGDLEHLPIVDVIQLLHATRKSGTLCLRSDKGESQLVFRDGCIVSANHANNSVRIGQILVQMNAISSETLETTLTEQKTSGGKTPLIAALIESGRLKKEDAFRGLETLIEMTIVEVLTWTEGTFELDVDATGVSDEYRYIPEKMKLELNLNTQNVLMDALRIYDEKKRDGTLGEETLSLPEREEPMAEVARPAENDMVISIDDLGLDVLDDLEKVIPGFFSPVRVYDAAAPHREKLSRFLEGIPQEQQEALFAYLAGSSNDPQQEHAATTHAMILFSSSDFISHLLMTVCRQDGFFTFATDEEENLEHILGQAIAKDLVPVMLIDQRAGGTIKNLADLTRRALLLHPNLAILHLLNQADFRTTHEAMRSGARAALPKPDMAHGREAYIADCIYFLDTVRECLKIAPPAAGSAIPGLFLECLEEIGARRELGDIIEVLDRYLSETLGRAVTFVSSKGELTCSSIARAGSSQPLNISISANGDSLLHKALANGTVFFGESTDPLLGAELYSIISAPAAKQVLTLPFKCLGRNLAVTYADFGAKQPTAVEQALITTLARFAGITYENALYRKKFEKMVQSQQ